VLAVIVFCWWPRRRWAVRMQASPRTAQTRCRLRVADKIDRRRAPPKQSEGGPIGWQARQLSQQLAAEALSRMSTDLDQALLLAARAYQTADTAQARTALLRALWYEPHLLGYLTGIGPAHGTAEEVRFSADGTRIAANLSGRGGAVGCRHAALAGRTRNPGLDSLDSLSIAEDDTSLTFVVPGAGNLLPPYSDRWRGGVLAGTSPNRYARRRGTGIHSEPDGERIGAVGCRPADRAIDVCDLQVHCGPERRAYRSRASVSRKSMTSDPTLTSGTTRAIVCWGDVAQ